MTYSKVIKKLYTKLLGKAIKQKMTDLKILQNQIAYDYSADDIELLSETTVGQIIKGKRNLSFNASLAFQVSLNYKTPKELFFPSQDFEFQLIEAIIMTIITDSCFDQTILKKTLVNKLNGQINHSTISKFVNTYRKPLLQSLSQFIPEFPEEENSYQIAEKLTDWLSELACLIS